MSGVPLPPSNNKRRQQGATDVAAYVDERQTSDAHTVDSGAENNKRKSNMFWSIGKRIGLGAPKVSAKEETNIASPPAVPSKDPAIPRPGGKPSKAAPPAPDSGMPQLQDAKQRRRTKQVEEPKRSGFTSKIFERTSQAFKRVSFRKGANGHFDMDKAMAAARRRGENDSQNDPYDGQSDLPTPKYSDLPSLLGFTDFDLGMEKGTHNSSHDDDEERGSFIDDVTPKIRADTIIVVSFGEGTITSDMASQDREPGQIYPCLCGEPQSFNVRVLDKGEKNPIKFGRDAARRRGVYALEWFNDTENGPPKYTKIGDMLAYNSAHCLRRALKQDAVIFPMHIDMTVDRKVKIACMAFERIGARAVRIVPEETVALQYVTKQAVPTGMVLDIGHSMTRCLAIVEGAVVDVSLQRTVACGKTMTLRMFSLLRNKSALFEQNTTGMEFAREAKESFAFALDHAPSEQDIAGSDRRLEEVFWLNDGNNVTLGHERYMCAESLFQPEKDEGKLSYLKASSIQQLILDCLKANDREFWRDLLGNIVVIGGGANLKGLEKRLMVELRKLLPASYFASVNITIEPNAGWYGARRAALNEDDIDQWINRRDWRQGGDAAVRERILGRGNDGSLILS